MRISKRQQTTLALIVREAKRLRNPSHPSYMDLRRSLLPCREAGAVLLPLRGGSLHIDEHGSMRAL